MSPRIAVIGGLLLLTTPALPAQEPPQRAGKVTEGVRAVLVDVVVRDRRGQPVHDLAAPDFELLEDGVPQTIGAFSTTFDRPARSLAATAPAATATPEDRPGGSDRGPGVTAIVFDRLIPESRRTAVQAARSYVGEKEESADFVGVFGIDLSLQIFVPFTRNAIALREAFDMVQKRPAAALTSRDFANLSGTPSGTPSPLGDRPSAPGADALFTAMQEKMMRDFSSMEQDQQGYATTDGLFAIVNTLGRIPGRKSLVLFSQGIPLSDRVHSAFRGIIDAANRANVSIYTMQAAGLRTASDQSQVRDGLNLGAGAGIGNYSAEGGGDAYTRNLERATTRLLSAPQYSLGELAAATGGIFFDNTNNLRPAFERVGSDIRNYYLLGYTPANTVYDGKFRRIEVRVRRQSVNVAARRGYFAVRDAGGSPINEWESGALGALEQRPPGNAFPINAAAMLFPERGRPGLVSTAVSLKTAPLTFRPVDNGKTYTSDFTVLVRFVDHSGDTGRVVRKVSQHYEIRGPVAEIDGARNGEVIFYRESELPSGLYSVETVVHDALSGKSSVRLSTLEVSASADGTLRTSSLVLVKRTENAAEGDKASTNSFKVGGKMLIPNLGEPVRRASGELGFYFIIYPSTHAAPAEPTIELVHQSKVLWRSAMELGKVDAAGRIQQFGSVPVASLAPGTYELRAIIRQGSEQLIRSSVVGVVE
jgi:VWFA-related protein